VEPISPELVLVDPELARAERARLVERARLREYTSLVLTAEVDDGFELRSWRHPRLRTAVQRWVEVLTLGAWIGVAVGVFLFIEGLNR
jgi:hypothetical protein